MKLPPPAHGAQPTDRVSPAPVGLVRFRAKKRGDDAFTIAVASHSWFEARNASALELRCEPGEVIVEIEKEQ